MSNLSKLLKGVKYKNKPKRLDINIGNISYNSKDIEKNSIFVAIKGKRYDGHNFIPEAISRGAKVVVCQKDIKVPPFVVKILVDDTRKTLAQISNNFFAPKIEKIKLIGITGTNGKTTTSLLIDRILKEADLKTSLIGTLGFKILNQDFIKLKHTTPPCMTLHNLLDKTIKNNSDYVILEVSSHALNQYRVDGLDFKAAIFTNLTPEHLDYHKDLNRYLAAKSILFKNLKAGSLAVLNRDDKASGYLKKITKANILTYGIKNQTDVKADSIRLTPDGSRFILKIKDKKVEILSKLIGLYNIYNILAASCFCYNEGIDLRLIKKAIESVRSLPGRLQEVREGQPFRVFIDYAHTPDALENVLVSLKEIVPSKRGIITVFGCGGDRDKTKRPLMAKVAIRYSRFTIITTDNPRSEKPQDIFNDIISGFTPEDNQKYIIIPDRKGAIKEAFRKARDDDIILVAGKGHETTQIYKDKVIPFDDFKIARQLLIRKTR